MIGAFIGVFLVVGIITYGYVSEERRAKLLEEKKILDEQRKKEFDQKEKKEVKKYKDQYLKSSQEQKKEQKKIINNNKNQNQKNKTKINKEKSIKKPHKGSFYISNQNKEFDLEIEKENTKKFEKVKSIDKSKRKEAANLRSVLHNYRDSLVQVPNGSKDRVASIDSTILYMDKFIHNDLPKEEYNKTQKIVENFKTLDSDSFSLHFNMLAERYGNELKENRIIDENHRNLKNVLFAYANKETNWFSKSVDLLKNNNDNEYITNYDKPDWLTLNDILGSSDLPISEEQTVDIKESSNEIFKLLDKLKTQILDQENQNPITKLRKVRYINDLQELLKKLDEKLSVEELEVILEHVSFFTSLDGLSKAKEEVSKTKEKLKNYDEKYLTKKDDEKSSAEKIKEKRLLKDKLILLNIFINKKENKFRDIGFYRKGKSPNNPKNNENKKKTMEEYKKLKNNSPRKKSRIIKKNTKFSHNKNNAIKKLNNKNIKKRANENNTQNNSFDAKAQKNKNEKSKGR